MFPQVIAITGLNQALAATVTPVPAEDSGLHHSDADPLRIHGPAHATHPEEWERAIGQARELGVEVILREGPMGYAPGLLPGQPGQILLDPAASYGALLHEMRHLLDDRDAGWGGMRRLLSDQQIRFEAERRAYQEEIDYARSIGDHVSAEQLERLLEEERLRIFEAGG